jgi:tRNA(Ile)-lysidine synthase
VFGTLAASVLHVDHRLRGSDSDSDARFVSALCDRLGVPCRVVSVDVAAYAADNRLNLEDAGRRIRYREAGSELDARCAEAGFPCASGRIATAHTLDDRAETTLMRLAQGAGAGGLVSLPYARERIVRPLLDCARADVLCYLDTLGQDWREDATNRDTTRLRSRVRSDLMPVLREINPRFDEAIVRTLTVLADEDSMLDAAARQAGREIATVTSSEISIDRGFFAALPRALQRRVVRVLTRDAFPDSSRLEFEHIEAVCDGADDTSFARDLSGGLRAFVGYDRLIILRSGDPVLGLGGSVLAVPGVLELEGVGRLTAEVCGPMEPPSDPRVALLDADALSGELTVTSVRDGDRMRPFGMAGTRKVSDVLIDAKVPARARSTVPVVRDGERIVWVAGVRTSEDLRIDPGTQRTVRLTWEPYDPEGDAR